MNEFSGCVPFFPAPYPGESYYSVLCCYHLRSGNASAIHTQIQLFGRGINLFQTLLIPVCLHLLNCRVLSDNSQDPRSFALKNTALPLCFLNKQYVEKLPNDLTYDYRSSKHYDFSLYLTIAIPAITEIIATEFRRNMRFSSTATRFPQREPYSRSVPASHLVLCSY